MTGFTFPVERDYEGWMGLHWLLEGRASWGRPGRKGERTTRDNVSSVLRAAQRWCGSARAHTLALCTHSPPIPTSIPWLHFLPAHPIFLFVSNEQLIRSHCTFICTFTTISLSYMLFKSKPESNPMWTYTLSIKLILTDWHLTHKGVF